MEQVNILGCLKSTSAYVNIFNNQLFFYLIKHFPLLFYDWFWIYRNYASSHFTCILLCICTRIRNTEKGMRFFFFFKRKSFHRWNCLSHLRLSESFPRFWFTRFTPFLSGKASSKRAMKNWENWRGLFPLTFPWEPTQTAKLRGLAPSQQLKTSHQILFAWTFLPTGSRCSQLDTN